MMKSVEPRRDEQRLDPPQIESEIPVCHGSEPDIDQQSTHDHLDRESQENQDGLRRKVAEQSLCGVLACRGQPVERARRVMDLVNLPQHIRTVQSDMDEESREIVDESGRCDCDRRRA